MIVDMFVLKFDDRWRRWLPQQSFAQSYVIN